MANRRLAIALAEPLIKMIDERGNSRPETIESDLWALYYLELFTREELVGKLTHNEIIFLAYHCVQGIIFAPQVSHKHALITNAMTAIDPSQTYHTISPFIKKQDLGKLRKELRVIETIKASLQTKLNKLSEFQCYCIYRLIQLKFDAAKGKLIDHEEFYKIFE